MRSRRRDSAACLSYTQRVTYQFDSQTFVRRMEAAGMARPIAEELANALVTVVLDGFATKRDLKEEFERSDNRLRETALGLRQEIKDSELRVTLRLGAMLVASTTLTVAILGALIAFR